jgi:phosphohistidine phosphatase
MARTHAIYIVRHAIAGERGPEWPDDTKRPLTPKGVTRMRQQVEGLRALDVEIDVVFTSPLVRAHETAKILTAGLRPTPKLKLLDTLAPGHTPADVAESLVDLDDCDAIALVGHEPGLGELAAWLIGARQPLPFKKGGVARIEVPDLPPGRTGQLVWLATPKMLRLR